MHNRPFHRPRERGAVLLLVLVLAGIVGTLAASFQASIRSQLKVARQDVGSLQAQLAAQSGLEYAARQLSLNSEWNGTGPQGIHLEKFSFQVNLDTTTTPTLTSSGSSAKGFARLEAEFQDNGQLNLQNVALAMIGAELDFQSVQIVGELVVPDKIGIISDWVNNPAGGGAWVPGGPPVLGKMILAKTHVTETLWKYSDKIYLHWKKDEVKTDDPIRMPAWNLDEWLVPAANVKIFDHVTALSNINMKETAVFLLDPGDTLTLNQCKLLGGAVVWCENSWNLRAPVRNVVEISNCKIGTSSRTHVGLIAPAATITMPISGGGSKIHGLSYWGRGEALRNLLIDGQLFVVQAMHGLRNSKIILDKNLAGKESHGIKVPGGGGGVSLTRVWEAY